MAVNCPQPGVMASLATRSTSAAPILDPREGFLVSFSQKSGTSSFAEATEDKSRDAADVLAGSSGKQILIGNIRVSPKAVRDAYEKEKQDLLTPAQIRLRMIALEKKAGADPSASDRAEELCKRLSAGEDFSVLAMKHSQGNRAAAGGDWGWIEPKILRSDLADAVSALEPGQVSQSVETADRVYILKLEGRKNESVVPFADARRDIERRLRQEEGEQLFKAWTARLREDACVRVLPVAGVAK